MNLPGAIDRGIQIRNTPADVRVRETGTGNYHDLLGTAEVLGMSDRIIVMREGRISGELIREEADQKRLCVWLHEKEER